MQVCAIFFCNTLGINERCVRTTLKKVSETGTIMRDRRGYHNNHATVIEREKAVIEHIKMFKTVESHYVRKNVKYEYLPQELNIKAMHRMYIEWCEQTINNAENYDFYKRVFKERFNLKFQRPKKDNCDACKAFENIPDDLKTEELIEQNKIHLTEKDRAREYKQAKKDESEANQKTLSAAFDLEKVLLCPHGPTSSFYYSQRLKIHNFTITNIANMQTYCFLWNESECEKGSSEIATALQKYISDMACEDFEIIHLFADRCGGQNNNRMVLIALHGLLKNIDSIEELNINYLVSGHSQNENDSAHSTIEGATRNAVLYTMDDWESAIRNSFISNEVVMNIIKHTDIYNFKSAAAFPEYKDMLEDKVYEDDLKLPSNE